MARRWMVTILFWICCVASLALSSACTDSRHDGTLTADQINATTFALRVLARDAVDTPIEPQARKMYDEFATKAVHVDEVPQIRIAVYQHNEVDESVRFVAYWLATSFNVSGLRITCGTDEVDVYLSEYQRQLMQSEEAANLVLFSASFVFSGTDSVAELLLGCSDTDSALSVQPLNLTEVPTGSPWDVVRMENRDK